MEGEPTVVSLPTCVWSRHITQMPRRQVLHLHSWSPHHEFGWSHVPRDAEMVVKVMAAAETNPFTAITPSLINILTGQCDSTVMDNVTNVKVIGLKAMFESLSSDQKKISVVRLHTLHTKHKTKDVQGEMSAPRKSKLLPF